MADPEPSTVEVLRSTSKTGERVRTLVLRSRAQRCLTGFSQLLQLLHDKFTLSCSVASLLCEETKQDA